MEWLQNLLRKNIKNKLLNWFYLCLHLRQVLEVPLQMPL